MKQPVPIVHIIAILQKYHKETLDGNNSIFDPVRQFARYNKGNLSVYYLSSNVILRPKDKENLSIIPMSKSLIEDMMKYGMFHLSLFGHNFFWRYSQRCALFV